MGLRAWAQRRGDWVLALALTAEVEFELWAHPPAGLVVTGGRAALAVLLGLVTLPLAWRRRAPVAVLFVLTGNLVVGAFLIRHAGGVPLGVFLAVIVAFYSVGAHCEERRALRVGAGVLATIAAVDLTRGSVFETQGARSARSRRAVVRRWSSCAGCWESCARATNNCRSGHSRGSARSALSSSRCARLACRSSCGSRVSRRRCRPGSTSPPTASCRKR